MNRTALIAAAQQRGADVGARQTGRASRPMQRRCDEQPGSGARVSARLHGLEVRGLDAPDGPLVFEGLASVTGQAYPMWDAFGPYEELVHVGAFTETLAQDGLDVPLVIDHVSSRRIARTVVAESTLLLSEVTTGDRTGLQVLAPNLDRADPDVAYVVPKLRSGLLDEMSFRFLITSGRWSEDWTQYHIHAVDIHRGDVSIVGYGANPFTAGAGLRAGGLEAVSDDELRREVERRGLAAIPGQRAAGDDGPGRLDPDAERRAALHRILDAADVAR